VINTKTFTRRLDNGEDFY